MATVERIEIEAFVKSVFEAEKNIVPEPCNLKVQRSAVQTAISHAHICLYLRTYQCTFHEYI